MKRSQLLAEIAAAKVVTCSVPTCTRPVYCKGLCSPHYRRLRTTGEIDPEKPLRIAKYAKTQKCCGKPIYAKGLCRLCYDKSRRE